MNCLTITCIVSKLCPLFMRVPRGDRRNGDSPRQGIDTNHVPPFILFDLLVEMGIARDRALTHKYLHY